MKFEVFSVCKPSCLSCRSLYRPLALPLLMPWLLHVGLSRSDWPNNFVCPQWQCWVNSEGKSSVTSEAKWNSVTAVFLWPIRDSQGHGASPSWKTSAESAHIIHIHLNKNMKNINRTNLTPRHSAATQVYEAPSPWVPESLQFASVSFLGTGGGRSHTWSAHSISSCEQLYRLHAGSPCQQFDLSLNSRPGP